MIKQKTSFTPAEMLQKLDIEAALIKRNFVNGAKQDDTVKYYTTKKAAWEDFYKMVKSIKKSRMGESVKVTDKGDGHILFEVSTDAVYQRIEIELRKFTYKL